MNSINNIKNKKATLAQQALLAYAFLYAFMFNINIENINSVISWTISEAYQKLTKL